MGRGGCFEQGLCKFDMIICCDSLFFFGVERFKAIEIVGELC